MGHPGESSSTCQQSGLLRLVAAGYTAFPYRRGSAKPLSEKMDGLLRIAVIDLFLLCKDCLDGEKDLCR
jgi:hypothetical protein